MRPAFNNGMVRIAYTLRVPATAHAGRCAEEIMKMLLSLAIFLCTVTQGVPSEVVPPRMIVKSLIRAVQEGRSEQVSWYFRPGDEEIEASTELSVEPQLGLLNGISLDAIRFDKDEYYLDGGDKFIVKVLAPSELDFELKKIEFEGEKGPPWGYRVIAITKSAQPQREPER